MRVALLADLHANLEALTACLRHADQQGVDAHAFLGDLVGYGADPGPVVDLVRDHAARGAVVLMGNHDAAAAGDAVDLNPDAQRAIDWTRSVLDASQTRFLGGLPLIARHDALCFVHASAHVPSEWAYVSDDLAAARCIEASGCTWTFCGHVHAQTLYYQGRGRRLMPFAPSPGTVIPVGAHRRWLAIAGACGQPRDGSTAAAYAVFDRQQATLTFHRVPYDHARAARKIRAAGLPEALAARLEGR